MASHVFVIDTTARSSKVKTTPDKHLTDILEEACSKFGRDASRYGLKYNKKNIDLSLTIRLSGLSSGARLELVASSRSPSVVSVALQLPRAEFDGTSRLTDKFPSDTTLWLILRKFESAGTSARNFTGRGVPITGGDGTGAGRLYFETPVIQIMGRELVTFTDLQKTLAQLGFNSGNTLLRLSFRKTESPLEEAMAQIEQYFREVDPRQTLQADEELKPGALQNQAVSAPVDGSSEVEGTKTSESEASTQTERIPTDTPTTSVNQDPRTSSGPSQRPIAVFAPPSSSVPQAAQQSFNEKDYEPTIDHAKLHQQRLKANSVNKRLLTDAELAAQAEAQAQKNAQIKEVKIKVRFPDESQVEAPFSDTDTAKNLYDHVKGLMRQPQEPFSLNFSTSKGPKRIPINSEARLISVLGLAGRVLVNFVWEEGATSRLRMEPTLKDEFRDKAQQIRVQQIEGVEVEDKAPNIIKDKSKEEKEKKGGIPKWLKLPGKK